VAQAAQQPAAQVSTEPAVGRRTSYFQTSVRRYLDAKSCGPAIYGSLKPTGSCRIHLKDVLLHAHFFWNITVPRTDPTWLAVSRQSPLAVLGLWTPVELGTIWVLRNPPVSCRAHGVNFRVLPSPPFAGMPHDGGLPRPPRVLVQRSPRPVAGPLVCSLDSLERLLGCCCAGGGSGRLFRFSS
jgi:hypothetical protein